MIELTEGYVVSVDKYGYTLFLDKMKVDKNGEEVYERIGYYGTLKAAIYSCVEQMNRRKLSDVNCGLSEAVEIIKNNNQKLIEMLQRACDLQTEAEKEKEDNT